jgi:hypothetical protein
MNRNILIGAGIASALMLGILVFTGGTPAPKSPVAKPSAPAVQEENSHLGPLMEAEKSQTPSSPSKP